jgi:two-component system response regulator YcbB
MTFYLVDDDRSILKILTTIIDTQKLGKVIGSQTCPTDALEDILYLEPDICLIDCLMPTMDGNTLIRKIKNACPSIRIIMISQVSDSEIITESYTSGVDFYISKPINHIEVVSVIKQVNEKIEILRTLETIKSALVQSTPRKKEESLMRHQHILSKLGILGELGAKDILSLCSALNEQTVHCKHLDVNQLLNSQYPDPKIAKQRIRRALSVAIRNLANLGLEDFYNDNFQQYTTYLFDFENMKIEMDRIRGKTIKTPRLDVDKFICGLHLLTDVEMSDV